MVRWCFCKSCSGTYRNLPDLYDMGHRSAGIYILFMSVRNTLVCILQCILESNTACLALALNVY